MLEQILETFKKHDGPLSLPLLSYMVQIESSALEGMLVQLERKGHIVTVEPNGGMMPCSSCPIQATCSTDQKWYQLAEGD
jgi:hypothetical protein